MSDTQLIERLHKIGAELASLWGGYCESIKINKDNKIVEFYCVEHGEEFATSLTFDELEDEYDLTM